MQKKLKNFIQKIHNSSQRKYLNRMNFNKPKVMKEAKKYSKSYWDGSRSQGYGGYKYIPGYWRGLARKFINFYKLKKNAKILDIGCGKGFLLYEMLLLRPDLKITGVDVSKYALNLAICKNKIQYKQHKAQNKFNYKNNSFDLVISIGTLHNLEIYELKKSLIEIERISKNSYIMVESYRNNMELFNLQCWALTCESFFSKSEWEWIFKEFNYTGDYEFIFFR